eukprot:13400613-Ditylum_brightwellii.AAC.1
MTVKEWVAQVSELNGYLKDFPAHNGNKIQLLNDNELLDILEYGVPASWHREFTVQGFGPVDQGFKKIVEFCTCLESCEPSVDKPKDKKSPKSRIVGRNKTHNTKDCFGLKQCAKRTKPDEMCKDADKVAYNNLNAFLNAKVTAALNKAKKNLKKKTENRKTSQAECIQQILYSQC